MRIQITKEGSLLPVLLDREITASEYAMITYLLDSPEGTMGRDNSVGETTREDEDDCQHDEVDLDLGFAGDPAREVPDHGICASCGAEVHLEHDEDRVYWEID